MGKTQYWIPKPCRNFGFYLKNESMKTNQMRHFRHSLATTEAAMRPDPDIGLEWEPESLHNGRIGRIGWSNSFSGQKVLKEQ
jgi:hypothetical protein